MHGLQLPNAPEFCKLEKKFNHAKVLKQVCVFWFFLSCMHTCVFFFSCGCNCSGNMSFIWHSTNTVFDTHNIETVWNSYKLITINNKGGKFLTKPRCSASVGEYNKIILVLPTEMILYIGHCKEFQSWHS